MHILRDPDKTDDLVKIAVLRFFGDEPNVRQQFLLDLTFPQPPAPAPEILFQILSNLREFSQFFYGVFASLVASYIFYYIHGKRVDKQSREELERKLQAVLEEHKADLVSFIKKNSDLAKQFAKVDLTKHYMRTTPGMKEKWEIRLKIYGEAAGLLLDSKQGAQRVMEILDSSTFKDEKQREKGK